MIGKTRKALLLRVGMDRGTGGGLGPIFRDATFEYVPIPEQGSTLDRRTYATLQGGDTAGPWLTTCRAGFARCIRMLIPTSRLRPTVTRRRASAGSLPSWRPETSSSSTAVGAVPLERCAASLCHRLSSREAGPLPDCTRC